MRSQLSASLGETCSSTHLSRTSADTSILLHVSTSALALPLRTQFGWHVLQVLERKAVDLPRERLRAQARNVLRARKQDEALGEWLEQLKAQAFIEYKR